MLKLSQSSKRLPTSLFIEGISQCDRFYRERGGFGEIYRASYKGLMVALKRPSVSLTADVEEQRKVYLRFCQEVLTWRQLRHKFIVPLLGIDRVTFAPHLAMVCPWMEQGTALNYLKKNGISSVDRLLFEVAQGLAYLHSTTVVHGDLRGGNILITNNLHACLTDFGLAAFFDDTETSSQSTSNRAGSLRWMAPELIYPKRFGHERFVRTPASDAYAFACVCLELYTGLPPFTGLSEGSALFQIVAGQRPARPKELTSDALWEYMIKFWAEDAQARPGIASVVEFMGELCSAPAEDVEELAAGIHRQLCSHQVGNMCQNLTLNLYEGSSAETGSSSSYTSTSSSFWSRNFPRRFFIIKSSTEESLDLSVQAGTWVTKKHTEGVLNQAYRTSKEVFLIFSVKKTGEFYGYARVRLAGRNPLLTTVI
ncbi:kinase-like domain-containing protein [Mycena vulgaris]|nr:kinase-like domain-containing protein [Mycena vulgaris]